jgi:hypothetical protein
MHSIILSDWTRHNQPRWSLRFNSLRRIDHHGLLDYSDTPIFSTDRLQDGKRDLPPPLRLSDLACPERTIYEIYNQTRLVKTPYYQDEDGP